MPMTLGAVRDALAKYPADHPFPYTVHRVVIGAWVTVDLNGPPTTCGALLRVLPGIGVLPRALHFKLDGDETEASPILLRAWLGPVPEPKLPEGCRTERHLRFFERGDWYTEWDDGELTVDYSVCSGGEWHGRLVIPADVMHWLRTGEVEGA